VKGVEGAADLPSVPVTHGQERPPAFASLGPVTSAIVVLGYN
jgi:hypothetical protein